MDVCRSPVALAWRHDQGHPRSRLRGSCASWTSPTGMQSVGSGELVVTPSWLLTMSLAVTALLSLIDAVFDPTAPAWQVLRGLSFGVLLFALLWWLVAKIRQSGRTSGS
jgi:hypothetical protein